MGKANVTATAGKRWPSTLYESPEVRTVSVKELIAELQKYPADAIVMGEAKEGILQILSSVLATDWREAQPGMEHSWMESYLSYRREDTNAVELVFEPQKCNIRYYLRFSERETDEHIRRRTAGEEI